MRFVADESCDHRVVTALRDTGHDVLEVTETSRGAPDRDVLVLARRERRLLITEDRNFGQLAHAYLPRMMSIPARINSSFLRGNRLTRSVNNDLSSVTI